MRLALGGRIDRAKKLSFTWNGAALTGFTGDTIASALLANGVKIVARSFKYHRPRGVFAAWVDEPNAVVDVRWGDQHDPNARATLVSLQDGMVVAGVNGYPSVAHDAAGALDLLHRFLPAGFYYKTFMTPSWHHYEPRIRAMAGLGRVGAAIETRAFETRNTRCDVLVIGGGPAGIAAARAARAAGASVLLVDDRAELGGSLLWDNATIDDGPALDWVATAIDGVRVLSRSTVFGAYDHGSFAVLEDRATAPTGWAEPRLWVVRAAQMVFATGAIERPLVFPDNDRPGIMSANAVLAYLRQYGVLPGRRVIVATNNDSAYATAIALRDAGAVVEIADARPDAPNIEGIRVRPASVPLATGGRGGLAWVDLGPCDGSRRERVPADLLAVSGGWSPAVHLFSQAGGALRWDDTLAAFLPDAAGRHVAGSVTGAWDLATCLAQGHRAGLDAAGRASDLAAPHAPASALTRPILPLWGLDLPGTRQWVDYQNDVTAKDVRLAASEGYRSVEHLKRYTTLGMATDQGKTSNVNGLAILADATGQDIAAVGTTKFRPPFTPVPLAAIAGLRAGALFAPLRHLPVHDDHVALGAEMRDYGGWARPACYRGIGETTAAAIKREATNARFRVGLFDGSSLGKIEVQGSDAAAFLNLMYYNEVANLRPGRLRYCLLLRETGVVYDDGVVARLAADRYLLSPSSSHTAGVLAMLELWHQTEYPTMQVAFHDVTAAWATFAVSGPKSREIVVALGGGADLSEQALPHMAMTETMLGAVPCRIARVSFTGERSYEISVPSGYAHALWRQLLDLGEASGIMPYGIESLSVLRAEKGYILIGTDTDGMTLPVDLGLEGPLRAKKIDFVGKRSLLTPDATRPDRRQLVGLLPADPAVVPVPGTHAVLRDGGGKRSLGWITTACRSPVLQRSVALGMIESGRARMGETIDLFHLGQFSRATIVAPCFYDPAGEKLHG